LKDNKNEEVDVEKIIETITSAEYWAKWIGKEWGETMPSPIQNFDFNIQKSKMLNDTVKDVFKAMEIRTNTNISKSEDNGYEKNQTDDDWIEKALACYYAHTEQSLVAAISAFETYLKDRIILAFKNNPRILEKLKKQKISLDEVLEKGPDLTDKIHEIIGRKIDLNFWNPEKINYTYNKLFGFKPLGQKQIRWMEDKIETMDINSKERKDETKKRWQLEDKRREIESLKWKLQEKIREMENLQKKIESQYKQISEEEDKLSKEKESFKDKEQLISLEKEKKKTETMMEKEKDSEVLEERFAEIAKKITNELQKVIS